jgi:MFS family permease
MIGAQSFELARAPSHASQASPRAMPPDEIEEAYSVDPRLHRRTLLKLDGLLLPFLALLFLFNALDKSNVSRPREAHNVGRAMIDMRT